MSAAAEWRAEWTKGFCANGHPLGSQSWVWCDCPGAGEARGHHLKFCRVDGCGSVGIYPPEHTGPPRQQR